MFGSFGNPEITHDLHFSFIGIDKVNITLLVVIIQHFPIGNDVASAAFQGIINGSRFGIQAEKGLTAVGTGIDFFSLNDESTHVIIHRRVSPDLPNRFSFIFKCQFYSPVPITCNIIN